jgi:fructose-1-phosphate kinase PfkB-like protein
MKKLLILGPNPAWQKVLRFSSVTLGDVCRARELLEFASGKGANFCRAAKAAGKTLPVLVQTSGGENGARQTAYLEKEKITAYSVETAPTRCCISCCEADGRCTELIEPGTALSEEQAKQLLRLFDRELADAGMAAFCGSLPDGSDGAFYHHAADLTRIRRVPLMLDTVRDLPELLDRAWKSVVKINRSELQKVTGEASVTSGILRLFEYPSLEFIAITDGPEQAYAATRDACWQMTLPRLEKILSPIGCGDTCGAVLAGELLAGTAPADAFAAGLAAASANCLTPVYGDFRAEDAAAIRRKIVVQSAEIKK